MQRRHLISITNYHKTRSEFSIRENEIPRKFTWGVRQGQQNTPLVFQMHDSSHYIIQLFLYQFAVFTLRVPNSDFHN